MRKIIKFISNNLWLTFILNSITIFDIIIWTYNKIKMTENINNIADGFPLDYNDYILLVVSIILFFILKSFKNIKKEIEVEKQYLITNINDISKQLTNNLNEISNELNTKIRYVDFRLENKDLTDSDFIKKLHTNGFSKEDLEEIGVDDNFIKQNSNKLLPRSVIKKYNEFKSELNKHNNQHESN